MPENRVQRRLTEAVVKGARRQAEAMEKRFPNSRLGVVRSLNDNGTADVHVPGHGLLRNVPILRGTVDIKEGNGVIVGFQSRNWQQPFIIGNSRNNISTVTTDAVWPSYYGPLSRGRYSPKGGDIPDLASPTLIGDVQGTLRLAWEQNASLWLCFVSTTHLRVYDHTGELQWTYQRPTAYGDISSSLVAYDSTLGEVVYSSTLSGKSILVRLDAETGEEKYRHELPWKAAYGWGLYDGILVKGYFLPVAGDGSALMSDLPASQYSAEEKAIIAYDLRDGGFKELWRYSPTFGGFHAIWRAGNSPFSGRANFDATTYAPMADFADEIFETPAWPYDTKNNLVVVAIHGASFAAYQNTACDHGSYVTDNPWWMVECGYKLVWLNLETGAIALTWEDRLKAEDAVNLHGNDTIYEGFVDTWGSSPDFPSWTWYGHGSDCKFASSGYAWYIGRDTISTAFPLLSVFKNPPNVTGGSYYYGIKFTGNVGNPSFGFDGEGNLYAVVIKPEIHYVPTTHDFVYDKTLGKTIGAMLRDDGNQVEVCNRLYLNCWSSTGTLLWSMDISDYEEKTYTYRLDNDYSYKVTLPSEQGLVEILSLCSKGALLAYSNTDDEYLSFRYIRNKLEEWSIQYSGATRHTLVLGGSEPWMLGVVFTTGTPKDYMVAARVQIQPETRSREVETGDPRTGTHPIIPWNGKVWYSLNNQLWCLG